LAAVITEMKKISILLTIISMNVYGQTENRKVYTHENYSIQYPSAWELSKDQPGAVFIIVSPVDTANTNFNKNVNLVIQDLKGAGFDLDKYNETSVKQIKQYLPNDTIIMDKKEKDGMGDCEHLIYVGDVNGNRLEFEQYYRIINEKAYILTFTALQKQWENGHQVGEQILNSFLIK
jgi:hypothetical protein